MSWGGKLCTKEKHYYVSSLMFKSKHGLNPYWINNNILMAFENHDRNTRFANNMNVVVPKHSENQKMPFHGTVCHLTLKI